MIVQIVRFKSGMSEEEVKRQSEARAPRFRALSGLLQKYYLVYAADEYGAVYVWDSRESLAAFRESELFRTIPDAYAIKGTPEITVADVFMPLR